MRGEVRAVGPLVVWTVLVWASRIRNVWSDDDLGTGGQVLRTGFAAVFLVMAVLVGIRLWATRDRGWSWADRSLVGAFVAWTVGFWLVRGVGILVDDHSTSFKAIHTVLMAISIWLAWRAVPVLRRRSAEISSSRVDAR